MSFASIFFTALLICNCRGRWDALVSTHSVNYTHTPMGVFFFICAWLTSTVSPVRLVGSSLSSVTLLKPSHKHWWQRLFLSFTHRAKCYYFLDSFYMFLKIKQNDYLLTFMQMKSQAKFCSPLNISAVSKWNSVTAFALTTVVEGDVL